MSCALTLLIKSSVFGSSIEENTSKYLIYLEIVSRCVYWYDLLWRNIILLDIEIEICYRTKIALGWLSQTE